MPDGSAPTRSKRARIISGAILAVLMVAGAGAAIAWYNRTSPDRASARCSANLRRLAVALSQYVARQGSCPPTLGHLVYCNVPPEAFVGSLSGKPAIGTAVDDQLVAWVNSNADYRLVGGQAEEFFVYETCSHTPDGKHLVIFADGELTSCTMARISTLTAACSSRGAQRAEDQ